MTFPHLLILCLCLMLMFLAKESGRLEGAIQEQARYQEPVACVNLRLMVPGAAVLRADGATVVEFGR